MIGEVLDHMIENKRYLYIKWVTIKRLNLCESMPSL
jgi:hypothetical protein